MGYKDLEKKKAYHKAYYAANKEKKKAYDRVYREANPKKAKAWKEANPEKAKAAERKRLYGISDEDYIKVVDKQSGKCAFTACLETKLVVDHCHKTNVFRGLLCQRHNKLLGFARDNPVDLTDAIQYLSPSGAAASEAE